MKSGKLTDKLKTVQSQFQDEQHELDTYSSRLQSVKQQLAVAQRNYQTINNNLEIANAHFLKSQKDILKMQGDELKTQADIQRLRSEEGVLEATIGELALTNFVPLTFEQGQEIVSGLFPTIGTEMTLRKSLGQFFQAADKIVRERSPKMLATDSALLYYRTPASPNEQLVALPAMKPSTCWPSGFGKRVRRSRCWCNWSPRIMSASTVRR